MKTALLAVAALGGAALSAQAALVGYWTGDGNANDLALGNHGTALPGVGFGPGKFGEAFTFIGGSGRVEIPSIEAYAFGTGDFAVAFWVNFTALNHSAAGMVSKDSYAGGGGFNGWLFNRDDGAGGVGMLARDSALTSTSARTPAGGISLGVWHHFAGVRANHELSFYVDGVLVNTTPESAPTNVTNDEPLRLGSLSPASLQTMTGSLDDVRVYNQALSAAEVQELATNTVPEPSVGMLLLLGAAAGLRRKRAGAFQSNL